MMRHWREREFEKNLTPAAQRQGLRLWAMAAQRPALYRFATRIASGALRLLGRKRGSLRSLPFAGGWTGQRDLPVPRGPSFMDQWRGPTR
jgi:L-lactate dehydrogenase complex protein LldF